MTYTEIAALRRNSDFVDRVSVAVSKASVYILTTEAQSVASHNARVKWAQTAVVNPDTVAMQIMAAVVGDTTVQANGLATTDEQIQYVVETFVNTFAER